LRRGVSAADAISLKGSEPVLRAVGCIVAAIFLIGLLVVTGVLSAIF
jgi:hypothetical protein